MKVGSIDIIPIHDGVARMPREFLATGPAGTPWDCAHDPLDDQGRVRIDIGSFLVTTGDRTILVDLGVGPGSIHEAFVTGGLLANLARVGVEPGDVTDVVFTHLHIDHSGWASVGGAVTFPHATYRVHAADWAHFMTGPLDDPAVVRHAGFAELDVLARTALDPVGGQLETFDAETDLAPGFRIRPAPGHTPGSSIFVVADGGERALLLGDVTHSVTELTDPEWEGLHDLDPVAAADMRRRIADELADTGDPFAPGHLPELAFGRLVTAEGLRRFEWA